MQARRQLNWNGGGMDSQYKLLSELLSDQAAFITSPKTSLANYWGALPPAPPPSVYGPAMYSDSFIVADVATHKYLNEVVLMDRKTITNNFVIVLSVVN